LVNFDLTMHRNMKSVTLRNDMISFIVNHHPIIAVDSTLLCRFSFSFLADLVLQVKTSYSYNFF